jgi:proteasome lid subunit RPN8/RPN11
MKKVILEAEARFKLERLCDAVHPQECGGALLGPQTSEIIWIKDIFPVPNVAEPDKNNTYKEHSWSSYWRDLYKASNKSNFLGTFHSHPNGTIPSEQDMRAYNDSNLHLWVVHHDRGEHTFQASIGLTHANLELAPLSCREVAIAELTDSGFRLGDIFLDEHGRVNTDNISSKLLTLNEKDRVTYIAALRIANKYRDFYVGDLAKKLNLTRPTTYARLKSLAKSKLVSQGYKDRWSVANS